MYVGIELEGYEYNGLDCCCWTVVLKQTEYIEEGEYADDVQPGKRSTFDHVAIPEIYHPTAE